MFARFLLLLSAPASAAAARDVFVSGTSLLQFSQGSFRGGAHDSRAIHSGDQIFLKVSETGNVVTAQEDGEVHTHWNHRGDWQKFVVERADGDGEVMSGDAIFLTAWTGKRITVEGAGVHALWDHMGDWQKLTIEAESGPGQIMPGSAVFLKGHTGARLDGGSVDKPGELHARFADQGTWQRFVIELAEASPQPGTTAPQTTTAFDVGTTTPRSSAASDVSTMAAESSTTFDAGTTTPQAFAVSDVGAMTPGSSTTSESGTVMASSTVSLQAWEHFQLIQSLRANGFVCPNGTVHPANPEPLQFECRFWKAAVAQPLNMTMSSASISQATHVHEQGIASEAKNLISGSDTVLQALEQFKASDEYCANRLNGDFKVVGVAEVEVGTKQYWTQMFSRGGATAEPVDVSCYPPNVA